MLPSILIAVIGFTTLVTERDHFSWFYLNPTQSFFESCKQQDMLNFGRHEHEIGEFYNARDNGVFIYNSLDNDCTSIKEFQGLLQSSKFSNVSLAILHDREVALVNKYFPYVISKDINTGYENFVFSKKDRNNQPFYYLEEDLLLKLNKDPETRFGKAYQLNCTLGFDSLINKSHDIVDMFVEIEVDSVFNHKVILASEIRQNGEEIKWMGANSKQMMPEGSNRLFLVNSYSIPWDEDSLQGITIKNVIWNPGKTSFVVKKYGYGVREGNKNRYSIYSKLRY